jgi:hypothetical protein
MMLQPYRCRHRISIKPVLTVVCVLLEGLCNFKTRRIVRLTIRCSVEKVVLYTPDDSVVLVSAARFKSKGYL